MPDLSALTCPKSQYRLPVLGETGITARTEWWDRKYSFDLDFLALWCGKVEIPVRMCGAARAVVRLSTTRTVRLSPLRKPQVRVWIIRLIYAYCPTCGLATGVPTKTLAAYVHAEPLWP